ncbi:MAG: YIP1 family protein [Deltaproteobacteria bacterium]|nr:YIP1 family protein [Deltaproteobacteria bacterium]
MKGQETYEFDPRRFFPSFFRVSKAILLSPREFFHGMRMQGSFMNPFFYLLSCILFHVLVFGVLQKDPLFMLRTTILGLVFPLITAGILFFIITREFRAQGSYETAFRVNAYASAVNLITWLPLVGLLLEFYRIYLIAIGLRACFSIKLWQAFLAILITMAIYITAAGATGLFSGGR